MLRFLLPLALCAAAFLIPSIATAGAPETVISTEGTTTRPAAATPQTTKEPRTGHRFPDSVLATMKKVEGDAANTTENTTGRDSVQKAKPPVLDLIGLACRDKTILSVKVYSYVLYVDRHWASKELAEFRGLKLSELKKQKKLYELLLQQNAIKELRLRFARTVDAKDAVKAFEKSLTSRILERKAKEKGTREEKLAELERFQSFFKVKKLKKGDELRFTWHPDGTLCTVVNGKRHPDMLAPHLAASLFDVYLGEKPISKSGKNKLLRRLPDVLNANVKVSSR